MQSNISRAFRGEPDISVQHLVQLPFCRILQNQINTMVIVKESIQTQNIGVSEKVIKTLFT